MFCSCWGRPLPIPRSAATIVSLQPLPYSYPRYGLLTNQLAYLPPSRGIAEFLHSPHPITINYHKNNFNISSLSLKIWKKYPDLSTKEREELWTVTSSMGTDKSRVANRFKENRGITKTLRDLGREIETFNKEEHYGF